MIDNSATDGEHLCHFINYRLLAAAPWTALSSALVPTGRHSDLVDLYRQIAAVSLTGRVVSAGDSLAEKIGMNDPAFRREFTGLFRDYVGIPYSLWAEFFRFSQRAIAAARESFRNSLQRQLRSYAMYAHPKCYMCGVALNFEDNADPRFYTCEHIWPRSYGGNTAIENLLPACASCNSKKKAGFATWVMPAIQSLILGLYPTESRLQEIHGSYKFAIHYRAAQAYAIKHRITLKDAFLQIGPWKDVRVRDTDDIVDVFNLENHDLKRIFR
jgi:HNH endonuclease